MQSRICLFFTLLNVINNAHAVYFAVVVTTVGLIRIDKSVSQMKTDVQQLSAVPLSSTYLVQLWSDDLHVCIY